MGDFRLGDMIARDGKTVIYDANTFGQEISTLSPALPYGSSPASTAGVHASSHAASQFRRRLGVVDRSACCGKGLRTVRQATIAFRRLDDR
jgi:hypothetical protein